MDPTFIQWLIGQAGIGGLAAFALYFLNRANMEAISREENHAQENRADKQILLEVLSENAKALASLEQAIRQLKQ